jgi:hypothetical protein
LLSKLADSFDYYKGGVRIEFKTIITLHSSWLDHSNNAILSRRGEYYRAAPFDQLLKHQMLKHQLLTSKHQLSIISIV